MGPRLPYRAEMTLILDGRGRRVISLDIGRHGLMLERPADWTMPKSLDGHIMADGFGTLPAHIVAIDPCSISVTLRTAVSDALEQRIAEAFRVEPAAPRQEDIGAASRRLNDLVLSLERANAPAITEVRSFAADIEHAFSSAITASMVSVEALFSSALAPIPGTDPVQYSHPAGNLFESVLPGLMQRYYRPARNVVYAVATDRNGYVPVHHSGTSQSQRVGDLRFNHGFARNRRIFDDLWTLRAAAFSPHPVVQTYRRDVPFGFGAVVREVSAPIVVFGKRWGAAQMGFSMDDDAAEPDA